MGGQLALYAARMHSGNVSIFVYGMRVPASSSPLTRIIKNSSPLTRIIKNLQVKSGAMLKGRAFLNDLVIVLFERSVDDDVPRSRHPYFKELYRTMFFPARPRPAGAPNLHQDDAAEIAWARDEVGVVGDDPITKMFFRDEERATPERILEWTMFYARVLKKVEEWSIAHDKQFRLRSPLPLPNANRKHLPVDKVVLHCILALAKTKFENSLDEVNDARAEHGEEPISWDSLDAPDLPSKNKFAAKDSTLP